MARKRSPAATFRDGRRSGHTSPRALSAMTTACTRIEPRRGGRARGARVSLEARLVTSLALSLTVVYWATPVAIRVAARLRVLRPPDRLQGPRAADAVPRRRRRRGRASSSPCCSSPADWHRTLPLVAGVGAAVGRRDGRRPPPRLPAGARRRRGRARRGAVGARPRMGARGGRSRRPRRHGVLDRRRRQRVQPLRQHGRRGQLDGRRGRGRAGACSASCSGDTWLAVAGAALSGACLGFLPHNLLRSPARIFLGDGGSMPVGFAVAALAMIGRRGARAAPGSRWPWACCSSASRRSTPRSSSISRTPAGHLDPHRRP